MCKKILEIKNKLNHILGRSNVMQNDRKNVNRNIPKESKLQILDHECQIVEAFVSNRHHKFALKYFLEAQNTAIGNWAWLETLSTKSISLKIKFQTETIHKLSLSLHLLTNSFESILIYQLANLNDPSVKESIQKLGRLYHNSIKQDGADGENELKKEFKKSLKFIWRMDMLSLLVIYMNTESVTSQQGLLKRVKPGEFPS